MCIKYIRRYSCPKSNKRPDGVHVLESTIPCSSPIACVGDGFGIRDVSFSGPCEQHTSPQAWATFDNLAAVEKPFQLANSGTLISNLVRYIDSLLDFLAVSMNEALPKPSAVEYVALQSAVDTIASQNRAMYNISRAFRTAEAQRLLPILRRRFGEDAVRQAVQQTASFTADANRQGPQQRLLYDVDPPSHGETVIKERKLRDTIVNLAGRRKAILDQEHDLARVQWSAINIIGTYVKFDSARLTRAFQGVPSDVSDHIGRTILPMLYPQKAIQDNAYRFGFSITSANKENRRVISSRLSDNNFWASYQGMIRQFASLVLRNDEHKRDLNAISVALANRMEDLRITFHDLHVTERATFHAIAKDLLPVMKHVTTEELEYNLANPPAKCTVCDLPFSTQVQEPATPAVGTFPATQTREQQVHTPVRYQECAFVPHQHAFCLREWGRQLMRRSPNKRITGVKSKDQWRCNTCYVDPWRAG